MKMDAHRETFMTLLAVARENDAERKKILSILELEPTRRKIAVNILVTEMQRNNAPTEFIEAWDSLQDDALAEAARSVIGEETLERRVDRRLGEILLYWLFMALLMGGGCYVILRWAGFLNSGFERRFGP